MSHEPREAYDGPASLEVAEGEDAVQVRLRGRFQPIDGRFHWWGRLSPDPSLEAHRPGSTVTLRTPHGAAEGTLTDLDPWGRFRISGTGQPPF